MRWGGGREKGGTALFLENSIGSAMQIMVKKWTINFYYCRCSYGHKSLQKYIYLLVFANPARANDALQKGARMHFNSYHSCKLFETFYTCYKCKYCFRKDNNYNGVKSRAKKRENYSAKKN